MPSGRNIIYTVWPEVSVNKSLILPDCNFSHKTKKRVCRKRAISKNCGIDKEEVRCLVFVGRALLAYYSDPNNDIQLLERPDVENNHGVHLANICLGRYLVNELAHAY